MNASQRGGGDRTPAGGCTPVVKVLMIAGLTVVVALGILVRPLGEPDVTGPADGEDVPAAATGTATPTVGRSSTSTAVAGSAVVEPSPTSHPTTIPTWTPTPTPSPTATPKPTDTKTPLPTEAPASPTPPASPTSGAASQSLAGRVEQGSYWSQVTGREESYRIYLPPGYDQGDRRYPVLYLLHGWPYDESHWDLLGVEEAADAGIVAGTYRPFIIVLPGGGSLYVTTSGGAQSFEEQLVNGLMPHIDGTFRSVQTREARAIGGISRGGVWALEIAFRHTDAFGIVGAHSPALSANRAPSVFDPFTLLAEPGVESLRIYLSAGDADWARQETVELHQALSQASITSQLAIHEGVHGDQLWREHLDEYLAFYTTGW